MHESTAYDVWAEEFLRGQVRVLLRVGTNKLGSADEHVKAALAEISDPDRLDRMADAISTATTWKDVLETF